MSQVPTIGRIVHYHWPKKVQEFKQEEASVERELHGTAAAIITYVYEDQSCDLKVFFGPERDGLLGDERHRVSQTPNKYGVYWSWPQRV